MNPNYTETITLYHRQPAQQTADRKEHWSRAELPQCFFKAETTTMLSDTSETKKNTYTVRIPAVVMDGLTVAIGDIVVYGSCADEITGKSPDTAVEVLQRHKPGAFRVTAVSDNTHHRMGKHFRLGG